MSKYFCHYMFHGAVQRTQVPSIWEVKEGFWVDEELDFTKLSNNKYWIPPGQILYVEKVIG